MNTKMKNNSEFNAAIRAAVEQVRREFPRAKIEEVRRAIEADWSPDFVDVEEQIDELDFNEVVGGGNACSAQSLFDHIKCVELRDTLKRIAKVTTTIGGKMVAVGSNLIKLIIAMVNRFPNFTFGMIIMAMLIWFAGTIPLLGKLLVPLLSSLSIFVGLVMFVKDLVAIVGESLNRTSYAIR